MNVERGSRKTLIVLIVMVLIGVIFGVFNIPSRWMSSEEPVAEFPVETVAARICTMNDYETASCPERRAWRNKSFVGAWQAGDAGAKRVRVPEQVEQAIRKAVRQRGPKFQRRVWNNMGWYRKTNWYANCFAAIGTRQFMPAARDEHIPRCLTPQQQQERFGQIHRVYIDCTTSALVAGGVGKAFDVKKRNVVVGIIGADVACIGSKGVMMAYDDTKWQRGYLSDVQDVVAAGFKSLGSVVANRLYGD